jgi:hypothetical protein
MRQLVASIVCAVAVTTTTGRATTQPVPSRDVLTLLHQAAGALGGEATLRSTTAVAVDGVSVWHQREQSERPEGPWVLTFGDFSDVRDFASGAVRRSSRTRGYAATDWVSNKDWDPESTVLVVSGVAFRRANDRLQPTATPWDLGTLPLMLGPDRVVLTALDARDVRAEADAQMDGYAHRVIGFTYEGAKVRLFLNVPSLLPKAVEITRARPYDIFWALWGDIREQVKFGIWTIEEGGFRFPRLWDFTTGGESDGTIEITRVRRNPAVAAAEFSIPDDLRLSAIVNRRRVTDTPLGSPQRPARELAPGIVHVPGSWDVVEVRQPDGIVILEGPLISSYSTKVIDDAQARFTGTSVKAVVTTSDSWPHIGGLREYVAKGLAIYALDLNVPILKRLFAAPHTTYPDTLARSPKAPSLKIVSTRTVVGSGANRLEIVPYRTASGERQMMVYFPEHRLLYTSDLFTIRDGLVFLPQQIDEGVRAAAREHLVVDRAFGMHYDVIPWQQVVDSAAPKAK